jgi:cleavage and polyadenylation specificity factor subunit 4
MGGLIWWIINIMANKVVSQNDIIAAEQSLHYQVDVTKKKKTVCQHWINQLCQKGKNCEFLHSYVMDKVPTCKSWSTEGTCAKGNDCFYQHTQKMDSKKTQSCPYYERGFCKLGPGCTFRHENKKFCTNYAIGFCPKGPNCELAHAQPVIMDSECKLSTLTNFPKDHYYEWVDKAAKNHPLRSSSNQMILCHNCGQKGHKNTFCQNAPLSNEQKQLLFASDQTYQMNAIHIHCYKCKERGHYADACPKKNQKIPGEYTGYQDMQM